MNLPILPITEFEQLTDYNKFLELIQNFTKLDVLPNNPEFIERHFEIDILYKLNIQYEQFVLEYKELPESEKDEYSTKEHVSNKVAREINFYDDYLLPGIEALKCLKIGQIEERRKKERKYSKDEKLGYYDELDSELSDLVSQIQDASHLESKIIDKAIIVIGDIKDYILEQKMLIEETVIRIPFTITRDKLALLMGACFKHGLVSSSSSSDFSRIISATCFYGKDKKIDANFRNLIIDYSNPKEGLDEKKKEQLKALLNTLSS